MLYVLEQKSRAGIPSPALDTFIMSGFESESDCISIYDVIAGTDSRTRVSTLDKYLSTNKYPRFRDETGKAGVIRKFNDSFTTFPLVDITARLIRNDVMMIDVVEGNNIEGKYLYAQEDMDLIWKTNDRIKDSLLLGKDYCGSYIYRTHSGLKTGLEEFIVDAKKMRQAVRFLVVYINPTIRTLVETENMLYASTHESIVVTGEEAVYQVIIEDSKLSLSVLEVPQISYKIR